MLKDFYVTMKFFGTSDNDYDVVALVLGPEEMGSDALGLRLRCNKTGQVRGRVVDEKSIYWNLMKRYFRPGFHIIQARLSEFIEFSRDAEGSLWTANDLLFEVIDEFGNPIANDQIFAFYSQRSLTTPTRHHINSRSGQRRNRGFPIHRRHLALPTESSRETLSGSRYSGLRQHSRLGSGRIARHFLEDRSGNVVGADIDAFNVKWFNESVGREVAIRIDFDPPMPFPADHFDIIYGHSVFTHLT
jgi:hypothetical protein